MKKNNLHYSDILDEFEDIEISQVLQHLRKLENDPTNKEIAEVYAKEIADHDNTELDKTGSTFKEAMRLYITSEYYREVKSDFEKKEIERIEREGATFIIDLKEIIAELEESDCHLAK